MQDYAADLECLRVNELEREKALLFRRESDLGHEVELLRWRLDATDRSAPAPGTRDVPA